MAVDVPVAETVAETVERLAAALCARSAMLATVESCTGGLVAAACTSLAGSSLWFERGIVSYSNAAKTGLLGVSADLIAAHGAVSAEVARAMAEGVLRASPARFAVAVTGVAGPGGGTAAKPVGTVWLAVCERGGTATATLLQARGDRATIRGRAVARVLELALDAVLDTAAPVAERPR
ncbi:MAG: nicotinamide-nucleotide amidohydrolase family protein [Caldimonas sp.]